MIENCKSCAFWKHTNINNTTGQCHRRCPGGPYPFEDGANNWMPHVDVWPHTEPTDFCGEWELKDVDN
jgi:hypothetical protein